MLTKEECEKALDRRKEAYENVFKVSVIERDNEFYEDIDTIQQLINEHFELLSSLKYYLDTNEENGYVYIPKFIIEKSVYPRKEKIKDVD